jgi:two-component system sensor kinase FixL
MADHINFLIADDLSAGQMRAFFANMPLAMILADKDGRICASSSMVEEQLGYSEADLLGQNLAILMGSPHAERHDGYLRRYRDTGERRIIGNPRLENARHKNGHALAVEVTVGETEVGGRQMFLGILRLLERQTSNRQTQTLLEELAHISRVSAMGALSTAIAHELNQPLSIIANFAEGAQGMLLRRPDADDFGEIIDVLEKCSQQAVRAGQLLHRLREFVRSGEVAPRSVAVAKLVDDTVSLSLINGYRRTVTIERDLPAGLPALLVDPLQAEQVLFNLMRNAFEAMDPITSRPHRLSVMARATGTGMVAITVADSGPGIDPDIRSTLFQSFVTTKAGGMGVGLAICREIAESYGGTLVLDEVSPLGGAAFTVTFPVVPDEGEVMRIGK